MTAEEKIIKAYDIALGLKSASCILETYTQNVNIHQAEIDNIYWISEKITNMSEELCGVLSEG